MSFNMAVSTQNLQVIQYIIVCVVVFVMYIYHIVTTANFTNLADTKLLNKSKCYLPSFIVFHSIFVVASVYSFCVFFVPLLSIFNSMFMPAFFRASNGRSQRRKYLSALFARLVFIHISYPITYRISLQLL